MAHSKDPENVKRILECPICLECMRDPRILPCHHSFCEKCVGQHMEGKQKNGFFPCPLCNSEIKVPPEGVVGFKLNTYLSLFGEIFPDETDAKCDFCKLQGTGNFATSFCIHCAEHLCQRCADSHCLTKFTLDHKVVSMEEVRDGHYLDEIREIRRLQKMRCSKHAEKNVELYCESCAQPVCYLCAMLEHRQHVLKNIEEAVAEVDKIMEGLIDEWKTASSRSALLSCKRKKVIDDLRVEGDRLIESVDHMYQTFKNDIIAEIELKTRESIGQIKVQIGRATKQAEAYYNAGERTRMTINATLNSSQEILASVTDVAKLQHFQDIKARLENRKLLNLDGNVNSTVYRIQSDALTIPDLTVTAVERSLNERVASCSFDLPRQCDIDMNATLLRCLDVKAPFEGSTRSYGLMVNDSWLITGGYNSKNVKIFDRCRGSFLFEVDQSDHKLVHPRAVTCNSDSDIFVFDDGIQGVVKYNSKGQVVMVKPNMTNVMSTLLCHNEQIVWADRIGGRVLITDFDCNVTDVISKESLGLSTFKPFYVCVDNEGNLVVGDYGQGCIHVIDQKNGVIIKTLSDELTAFPWGVCVDKWGNILVADFDNSQVMLISACSDHARILITSDDISCPTDLAVTGSGEVAVLERDSSDVKIFKYADWVV